MGDDELDITAVPGAPVKFDYKAGFQAQLDVNIEWSEPRDTTLFMWVGLAVQGNQDRATGTYANHRHHDAPASFESPQ